LAGRVVMVNMKRIARAVIALSDRLLTADRAATVLGFNHRGVLVVREAVDALATATGAWATRPPPRVHDRAGLAKVREAVRLRAVTVELRAGLHLLALRAALLRTIGVYTLGVTGQKYRAIGWRTAIDADALRARCEFTAAASTRE
jgi:hypothetical protein